MPNTASSSAIWRESITGYRFEPWHYRYVGAEAAKACMEQGIAYEEYLALLPNPAPAQEEEPAPEAVPEPAPEVLPEPAPFPIFSGAPVEL